MTNQSSLKKLCIAITFCAFTILLQGCGNKVDCNGNKIKENAIEIIQSHLNTAVWYTDIKAALSGSIELTNIKTLSHNDELKQAECSATYTFNYNGKPREIAVVYDLGYLQDKGEVEVKVAVDSVKAGIMGIAMMEKPIKNGEEKIVDPATGNLTAKLQWKNGVQDGVQEVYNPANNKMINQINYDNGKKNGVEKGWSADGSVLLIDLNWVDGKPTGFQKEYYGDKLITDLTFKDGKATGLQTTGNMAIGYDEYQIKDSVYNGIHNQFQSHGKEPVLLMSENFKDGKLDGLRQRYDDTGTIVTEEQIFKDGVFISEKQIPQTNAAVAANSPKVDACVSSKIDAFHKQQGADSPISNDMLEEWGNACKQGLVPAH